MGESSAKKARDEKMRAMRLAGATLAEISSEFGVSITWVWKVLGGRTSRAAAPTAPKAGHIHHPNFEEMHALRLEGATLAEISAQFGMSIASVWKVVGPKKIRKGQLRLEEMKALRLTGATLTDLATRFKLSLPTVSRFVRDVPKPKRPKRPRPIDARMTAMQSLRLSGINMSKIGAQFGLSRERVRQLLKELPKPEKPQKPQKWPIPGFKCSMNQWLNAAGYRRCYMCQSYKTDVGHKRCRECNARMMREYYRAKRLKARSASA